jgi:hypothetical protein
MRTRNISLPLLVSIAGTRGMLGAGIGLLVARRLSDARRRNVGRTLLTIGVLSTFPLLMKVFRRSQRSSWNAEEVLG